MPVSGGADIKWAEVLIALGGSILMGVATLLFPVLASRSFAGGAALVSVALIGVLRDGSGGSSGGYGVIVIVPVLWVALYGSRRQLWLRLAGITAMFVIPLLALGAPQYPHAGWRSTPLVVLSCTLVGTVVQELLAREQRVAERPQASHDRSAEILSTMREGFALTRDGVIVEANPALSQITGFPREQLIGSRQPFLFWPPEMLEDLTALRERIHASDGGTFQTTFMRADGARFIAETTAVPLHDADGSPAGFLNSMRDVTERVSAERALHERSEELAALAKVTRAVAHADPAQARETVREMAVTISGASSATIWDLAEADAAAVVASFEPLGTGTGVFLPDVTSAPAAMRARIAGASAHLQPILDGAKLIGVLVISWASATNGLTPSEASLTELLAHEAAIAIEKATAHAELERLGRTDALTGLPNRRVVEDVSRHEIASARRTTLPLAFAMLDLDHFKDYNDAHGHPAGDKLLRAVSANWARRTREADLLARWGGEEFCLLLPGCDLDAGREMIEELREVVPDGQTFSAGLVAWQPGMTTEDLVAAADQALYAAKRGGRDQTAVAVSVTLSAPPVIAAVRGS